MLKGGTVQIGGKRGDLVATTVEEADRVGVLRTAVSLPSNGQKKGAFSCWKSNPAFLPGS